MEQRVTKSETWQKQLVKHVIPGGGLWPGWNPSFNSVELRMSHSISSSLSFPIWYMRGKIVHITSGFHGGSGGKVGKIPWRRKWQPTPVLLPKIFHRQRSLVGDSPWGHKELDTHSLSDFTLTYNFFFLNSGYAGSLLQLVGLVARWHV